MRYANAKGLALAAGVLVVEIAVVAFGLSLDTLTPPTDLIATPDALAPLKLPVDPLTVVPHDQPGDAAGPIRAAMEDYLADPGRYESFIDTLDRARVPHLPALNQLKAVSRLNDPHGPLADRIDRAVVYGESPTVAALERVGKAAIAAGQVLQKDDPAQAWSYFEAAFSLGSRAVDERLSYREFNAGITLMSTAAEWMGMLAERTGRAGEAVRLARFRDALTPYVKARVLPTVEAIYSFDERKISEHAGDVFVYATHGDERMWRVEAILKLGRMRFNVGNPGRPGDQRNARRLLESMTTDDPVVQRAITLARGLTVEQFRGLR